MKRAELSLPERPASLHLVAVLDILVLLLVFFLLVASVAQEAGFAVDLAESEFRLRRVTKSVVVTVKGAAPPILYVGRERTTLNELEEKLEAARDGTGADTIVIKADKQLPVEIFMRLVDAGQKLGMRPVALAKHPVPGGVGEALQPSGPAPDAPETP